jgi:hypothetical protein
MYVPGGETLFAAARLVNDLGSSDERLSADLRLGLFGLGQILSSMCCGLKEVHQGCAHEMPSFLSWLSTGSVLSTC